ncbi:hypothetical protein IQ288_05065 [Burkholderia sp. R-69980]|uniref:hypothetical protein n=1 Tax=Paraburkholderia domus TaxID=2793075 RepID=UPI00191150DC|nr:hypothetical protein [Paraburkholderia domus]MBK5119245.1 hypothetical protein [Burkholderia sp. R-69980]CAE6864617.1 hypothetical protein R75471_00423 [Paraburkholderia domus]
MKTIIDNMSALKPWFDDPVTEQVATVCMLFASEAAYLRESKKPELVAEAAAMLRNVSKASKIPHSVIERYSKGVEALRVLVREERIKDAAGGTHGE